MSSISASASSPAIASNPTSPASDEKVAFTHHGQQYTATYGADGGVDVSRGGETMHFNAEQAADLRGLPTENTLWGASADAPDASFQGVPLGKIFDNPSSPTTGEPLW